MLGMSRMIKKWKLVSEEDETPLWSCDCRRSMSNVLRRSARADGPSIPSEGWEHSGGGRLRCISPRVLWLYTPCYQTRHGLPFIRWSARNCPRRRHGLVVVDKHVRRLEALEKWGGDTPKRPSPVSYSSPTSLLPPWLPSRDPTAYPTSVVPQAIAPVDFSCL